MMAVAVTVSDDGALTAGKPDVLFEGDYAADTIGPGNQNYDVAPDGRFLMIKLSGGPSESRIHVVVDFDEELKRLLP